MLGLFKKKKPAEWETPRMYTLLLTGRGPMQVATKEDLIAKWKHAVENCDPLITLYEDGEPASQFKTEIVDLVVLGSLQQEKPSNAGPKQLQP